MSFIVQLVQTNSTTKIITYFTRNVIKPITKRSIFEANTDAHIREGKSSMHGTGPHSICTSNFVTLAVFVVQE